MEKQLLLRVHDYLHVCFGLHVLETYISKYLIRLGIESQGSGKGAAWNAKSKGGNARELVPNSRGERCGERDKEALAIERIGAKKRGEKQMSCEQKEPWYLEGAKNDPRSVQRCRFRVISSLLSSSRDALSFHPPRNVRELCCSFDSFLVYRKQYRADVNRMAGPSDRNDDSNKRYTYE